MQTGHAETNGVLVTFTDAQGMKEVVRLPNVLLYVPANTPPSTFTRPGKFTADIDGNLSVELRGEYTFQAESSGPFTLEINGKPVLDLPGSGTMSEPSRPLRLSKGTNTLAARFSSPETGDAFVRLYWTPKNSLPALLPPSSISSQPSPELEKSSTLRAGRELFVDLRCVRCHSTDAKGLPDLDFDAPTFAGIGSRRTTAWMAKWIANPREHRASARMPKVFDGVDAPQKARMIAAFLGTQKSPAATAQGPTGQLEEGKRLFGALHCQTCHSAPGEPATDPAKISLSGLAQKFSEGSLFPFLKNPQEHFRWIRMPNFKLSDDEAASLSRYLLGATPPLPAEEGSPEVIEQGRKLAASSGCYNCHTGVQTAGLAQKPASELTRNAEAGCLAETPKNGAPIFTLAAAEKAQLREFLKHGLSSLAQINLRDFAISQTKLLNCAGCHDQVEGLPRLEPLGGKLRPEWAGAFIKGEVKYKPRPWLEARMPAFPAPAHELAQGLALLHGQAPRSAAEGAIDQEMAQVGARLTSANGGFSCISCHAVGQAGATQVFESAGINFAYSGERILKQFFHPWVRNPLAYDPTTKMPVYFDAEGRSPITDVYEGDGTKQIEALWQYIRLGEKMPPPPQ